MVCSIDSAKQHVIAHYQPYAFQDVFSYYSPARLQGSLATAHISHIKKVYLRNSPPIFLPLRKHFEPGVASYCLVIQCLASPMVDL